VIFFGTPGFAVPTLDAIDESRHTLVAVVTQPDRPRGRGQHLVPSAVKARAIELGVPVLQPNRLREPSFLAEVVSFAPDVGVVAAYGRILPQSLLDAPRLGVINVHASLLPRWRGAAPVHRAILAGDRQTGVTIMRVVAALDAGPTIARAVLDIGPDETSAALETRLAAAGGPLLADTLDRMAAGPVKEVPQDESAVTYAARLERHESQMDWAQPAGRVHDRIRGLQPWPLAAARLHGRRVLLIQSDLATSSSEPAPPGTITGVDEGTLVVATQPGAIRLVRIQPEGKPPMSVHDFLNGHPVRPGDRFEPLTFDQ
jgi:methionyl-tRNA formyltransferase